MFCEDTDQGLEALKINPDAKEAVLFAVLANESVAGNPPYFDQKLISTANVSTFLSPFARPILKLAHHSPGAILVGM